MVFGFENEMNFTMDIDMINLANLVGKVMNEIMEYQIVLPMFKKKFTKIIDPMKSTNSSI